MYPIRLRTIRILLRPAKDLNFWLPGPMLRPDRRCRKEVPWVSVFGS